MEELKEQECPICHKNTLTLREDETEVPYFGKVSILSMNCDDCGFNKSDVEAEEKKDPAKYTFEVNSEEDLNVRVVKSSEATVKIPHVTNIEPGPASNGEVTNIEGLLNKVQNVVESTKESEEDPKTQKRCKNILKKLHRVRGGREKLKITIEDPTGNSAIISDKAEKSKLSKKQS